MARLPLDWRRGRDAAALCRAWRLWFRHGAPDQRLLATGRARRRRLRDCLDRPVRRIHRRDDAPRESEPGRAGPSWLGRNSALRSPFDWPSHSICDGSGCRMIFEWLEEWGIPVRQVVIAGVIALIVLVGVSFVRVAAAEYQ